MRAALLAGALLMAGAGSVIGWTANRDHTRHPPADKPKPSNVALIESVVPFDVRITANPLEHCDPLEVDVIVEEQPDGECVYRWLVVDGRDVLMECDSFDELYSRCDGHGCYIVRNVETIGMKKRTIEEVFRHVCLK